MNKEQALQIIKKVIDTSLQKGVFNNIEEMNTVLTALNTLLQDLKKS